MPHNSTSLRTKNKSIFESYHRIPVSLCLDFLRLREKEVRFEIKILLHDRSKKKLCRFKWKKNVIEFVSCHTRGFTAWRKSWASLLSYTGGASLRAFPQALGNHNFRNVLRVPQPIMSRITTHVDKDAVSGWAPHGVRKPKLERGGASRINSKFFPHVTLTKKYERPR